MLLVNVNYVHWGEEHLSGHHELVATPLDPATSRLNESLFAFLPRCVVGSWRSSCNLERRRLEAEGKSFWGSPFSNRIFQGVGASFLWSLVLAKLAKTWKAVPIFFAQGALAASLLEVINYVEHYGLERKVVSGRAENTDHTGDREGESVVYEPVNPTHSWNAPNKLTNYAVFKLQRHSDHHTFASRPYEILRNFVESPQMPTGYAGMFILSFFPPVFRWILNDLLAAHKLEFSSDADYHPTEAQWGEIRRLKRSAKVKIWGWTLATFTGSTLGLAALLKRRSSFFVATAHG